MEQNKFGTGRNSVEDPSKSNEDSDSTDKKSDKKTSSEPIGSTEHSAKKHKVEREIGQSLGLSFVERPKEKPDAETVKAPEAASDAPLESLSETETAHLTQQIAQEHRASIEQADEVTVEQLEPAAEFLDRVADGEDTEEAFAVVAAELGLSEEEIAEALESDAEISPDVDDETDVPEAGEFDTSDDAEGEVPLGSSGSSGSGSGGSGSGGSGSGSSGPGSSSGGAGSTGGGTGGSGGSGVGGTPPPFGGGPAPVPVPGGGAPFTGAGIPRKPNLLPPNANTYYQDRNKAGQLLLIGLVGYLIGRRRGRIRAERKLLPVQRKLEKQVTALEQDITHKEQKLVALKAARQPERRPAVAAPSPAERAQPSRQETRLNLQKPARAEHLGHMIVAAEAPTKVIEKTKMERPNSIRDAFRAEEVKDMRRADLLELSEKIKVEGASLRSIYESRLIGEKQLRHLVSEYLQGKDIRKDLRKEMVEHEIDFERDPILRDRVRSMITSDSGSAGLGELLTQAGITNDATDPTVQHRVDQAERKAAEQEKKRRTQRIVADTSMGAAIVGLAVVVAILLLER